MFGKVDPAVKKETKYIAATVLICSAVMQAVYLIIGRWNYTVLLGNLVGAVLATGNFFLMGLTIQKALGKSEKDAAQQMKLSQRLRLLMMILIEAIALSLPWFDFFALLLPLLFPRIGVTIRGAMLKKEERNAASDGEAGKDVIDRE